MDVGFVVEALKFFQNAKVPLEGLAVAGTTLVSGAKATVYVVQKGAKLVSYLITRSKKGQAKAKAATKTASGEEGLPTAQRQDVALLVDINRRMLVDVSRYLEKQGIDADFIIVTNDPDYSDKIKFVDPATPQEWETLIREFAAAMNSIKRAAGGARLHIFLSAPLSLTFGLGSVWGTVDEATIYHWENNTYYPTMHISRSLRS